MSITIVKGIPGSGKTYYAVNEIYNFFRSDKEKLKEKKFFNNFDEKYFKDYDYCYTNINQFDFSFNDRIKKFVFSDFYNKISSLHYFYLNNCDDSFLIQKSKELYIYNSFFVIDESQNYFDSDDDKLVWFITYHRHLYLDIMLITQDVKLIFNKYRSNCEFFFEAIANSRKINTSKFKYSQYISSNYYKKDLIKTFSISFNDKVYQLYHSGNKQNSKSLVNKFIFLFFTLIIFSFLFFILFLYSFSEDEKSVKINNPINIEDKKNINNNKDNIDNHFNNILDGSNLKNNSSNQKYYYYKLICNNDNCYNDCLKFSYSFLKFFTSEIESDYLFFNKIELDNNFFYVELVYKNDVFLSFNICIFRSLKNDDKKNLSNFSIL